MKITEEIIDALVNDWLDYPEKILEEQGISTENMTEDEIIEKAEEILSHFEYLSTEFSYCDLEKGYEKDILFFKLDGVPYGVYYIYSPYTGTEKDSDAFRVEEYQETVTKYKEIYETN